MTIRLSDLTPAQVFMLMKLDKGFQPEVSIAQEMEDLGENEFRTADNLVRLGLAELAPGRGLQLRYQLTEAGRLGAGEGRGVCGCESKRPASMTERLTDRSPDLDISQLTLLKRLADCEIKALDLAPGDAAQLLILRNLGLAEVSAGAGNRITVRITEEGRRIAAGMVDG